MELERARVIADRVTAELAPYCTKLQIAGSIRRQRPYVHDIDMVCIPSNQGHFVAALQGLGKIKVGGQKLIRVTMPESELDCYIATPETWATLLLIRTGSVRHNIRLCTLARQKGMKLHADGSGLYRYTPKNSLFSAIGSDKDRIAGNTEHSIFAALGLKYKAPQERE